MDDHAIIIADRSGTIQWWSPGAERMLGYSREEAVGQKLDLIVPEEYREHHWNGFRQAMSTGSAKAEAQPFELPVNCRGEIRIVPGQFVLVRDSTKAVIGAMAIFNPPKTA